MALQQEAALKEALQTESAGRLREADENLRRFQELRDTVPGAWSDLVLSGAGLGDSRGHKRTLRWKMNEDKHF